ncbi:hypothetical protein P7L74_24885 [Tistrella mobilis]|uniref:hypothetical protein n=1 Tax=Tistrella mobilis TaxID=171437 RepID=UPI003557AAB2
MTMVRPPRGHAISAPATGRVAVPAPRSAGLRAAAETPRRGRTYRGPGTGTGTGSRNPRRRRIAR